MIDKKGLSVEIVNSMNKLDEYLRTKNFVLYGTEIGNLYMAVKSEILACNLSKDKGFEIFDEYGVEY